MDRNLEPSLGNALAHILVETYAGCLKEAESMKKSELLRALQAEIRRHDFSTFVDTPPSIAQSGNGVVTPGCPACRRRLFTIANFMDHLADDVLPSLLDKLATH
jgi:hypothetical protein